MSKQTESKGPSFQGEPDLATLRELIRYIGKTPAVTWTGRGGAKERILELIRTHDTDSNPTASEQKRDA